MANILHLPAAGEPRWIGVADDAHLLDSIIALPPPLPVREGGHEGALLAVTLARQWASSRAALRSAIRRRLARCTALADALDAGRHPSHSELATWTADGDAVQLAFAELLAPPSERDIPLLQRVLREHERALRALAELAVDRGGLDALRARHLADIMAEHQGERVVAFTQYEATALAYSHHLRDERGVAVLTARGARVAGGPISRRAALAAFAPRAQRAAPPRAIERIDLLITTDLLSEGTDLQDASVVVHLDLPWTAARLEQRVGRCRRLGSEHDRTAVYVFAPPAEAECLLHAERRILTKAGIAEQMLAMPMMVLPREHYASAADTGPRHLRARELMAQRLEGWMERAGEISTDGALVSAVHAESAGALALVRHAREVHLLALTAGGCWSELGADVLRAIDAATDRITAAPADEVIFEHALRTLEVWMAERTAAHMAGVSMPVARLRRKLLDRIVRAVATCPRHRRPHFARLASAARVAALRQYGIGAERDLLELAHSRDDDETWLTRVAAFPSAAPTLDSERAQAPSGEIVALLLLSVSKSERRSRTPDTGRRT